MGENCMRTVRLSISALLFSLLFGITALPLSAPAQIPPKRDHTVPLDSAKKFIKNLESDAMQLKTKGGMFHRAVFDAILSQKGCVGIRYYYAKTNDGTPTLVIVGVDSTGRDMSAVIGETAYPCPPFCTTDSLLFK